LAEKNDTSLSQFSLSWVLNQPSITSAIIGASKIHHVTEAVDISDWIWTEDLLSKVNEIEA
jgi:aryl-alcohol dehydrogenase-like predicted oxidoreductase